MPLGGLVPLGVGSSDTGILDGVALSLFLKVMHCHTLSSEEMSDSAERPVYCLNMKPFKATQSLIFCHAAESY